MAGAREVAEAYIQVNGDMRRFRNAIQTKGRALAEQAGEDLGKRFNKSFGDELRSGDSFKDLTDDSTFKDLEQDFRDLAKATRTGDFDRFFKRFNSNTELSRRRVQAVTSQMQEFGRISPTEVSKVNKRFEEFLETQKKAMDFDNVKFRRRIQGMEKDFRELADASNDDSFEKFWRRFNNDSSKARKRITEVTREMVKVGRMTQGQSENLRKMAREYDNSLKAAERARVAAQKEAEALKEAERARIAAKKEEEAQARRTAREAEKARIAAERQARQAEIAHEKARKAAERQAQKNRELHKTFEELQKVTAMKDLERDFERLARASRTKDFQNFFRNAGNDATKARARIEEVTDKMVGLGRMSREQQKHVRSLFDEFTRGRNRVSSVGRAFQTFQKIGSAAISKLQSSWKGLDSTVRLVLNLIAVAAGPIAAMLSAIGSSVVSIGSSVGMALGGIIPLIGAAGAAAIAIGLMVSAMDEMRARFPAINQGISRIQSAWSGWASNFAAEAGPGLGRVLNSLAQQMERFDFGTPMGRAMGGISDAFARVLTSPGVTAFFRSLTQEYPRALEAFGAGAANVFSALSSLLAGAAPAAERLGEMFRNWSSRLAEAAEQARTSGRMREVFDRVGDSVSAVLNVIGSLGRAIGAVFMATSGHGNDLLNGFAGLIDTFTNWVKSAEGQQRINEWLETGKTLLPAMGNLAKGAGQALAKLVTPDTIRMARDFLNTVGEWLPKFADVLVAVSKLDIMGNLANFLNMISDATAPLLPHMDRLAQIIGESVSGAIQKASPLFEALASAAEPLIERFVEIAGDIAPKIVDAIGRISTALGPVIQVFGMVANVIQSVVLPVFAWLVEGAIKGVVDAFEGLGRIFQGVIDLVSSLIEGDWRGAFSALGDIVMGAIQAVWGILQVWLVGRVFGLIKTVLSKILGFFGKIWGSISNVVSKVAGNIADFLSTVWNGIVTVITAVWSGIVSFLTSTWSGILAVITTVGTAIWGFIQATWETISEITTSVWNTIVEAIQIAWEWILTTIQTVANSISEFLTSAWEMISTVATTVWTTIGEFIATIWTGIQTAIQVAIDFIQTIISTAWEAIQVVISTVMEVISTVITTVWEGIQTAISTVVNVIQTVITTVWTAIQTATSTVMNAISTVITTVWTGIQTAISTVVNAIRTVITSVWNGIKTFISTVMNGIRTVFSTVWNAIRSVISSVINGIRSTISSVWNGIKSFISSTMNSIRSTFSRIWSAIKSVIQSNVNNIRSVIRTVWNGIKSFISTVMNGIRSTFSRIWNAIRSTISSVINGIRSVIQSVWNGIRSFISSVMSGIRSTFSSIWNSIRSVISSVLSGIRSVITSVWNGIRSVISSVMNGIRSVITSVWNGIRSVISSVVNGIRNVVSTGFNGAKNAAVNAVNALRNGVSNGFTAVSNAAIRVTNGIIRVFNNLIGKMRNIGRNIIQGVVNGVGSMAGALAGAARRVAKGAMDAIKGIFGIKSPSREMRKVGVWIGEGMNLGLGDEEKEVAKGMERLGEAAMGGLDVRKYMNAGADAAEAFANGLDSVDLKTLEPGIADAHRRAGIHGVGTGLPRQSEVQRNAGSQTVVENGAIQVNTPAQDGRIVAGQMLDEMVKVL